METHCVLTMASTVTCGHSGQVDISSAAKLKLNKEGSVLLESSISGKKIKVDTCAIKEASDNSGPTALPCKKVSAVPQVGPPLPIESPAITLGCAKKLKVDGKPVMLETLKGNTDGMLLKISPQNLLEAKANQTKLKAV